MARPLFKSYRLFAGADDRILTWESVCAHERAHAEIFFSTELPYIKTILSTFQIDYGGLSKAQIVSIVTQAITLASDIAAWESNVSANYATEEWYEANARWFLLDELEGGLVKKWIKE